MLQAKYRKILWILLAVHLILAHFWGLHLLWFRILAPLSRYFPSLFFIKLPPIWTGGAALAGLWQLFSYERFRRKALRGIEPIEESWIQGIHQQAAKEADIGVPLPMYQSCGVDTPMVIGFLSQVVLLPREYYSSASLRMILLHEYIHVKRGDIWYKLFFTAGTCILWFQPLMYLLKWAAFRDVEIACDQRAVKGKGPAERSAYGQLLIDSLKRQNRELPHSAYFYNSKAVMKARLGVVMDEREHPWYLGALLCLVLMVETGALVLTSGLYTAREIHRSQKPQPLINIYDGYDLPKSFTEEALEGMAEVAARGSFGYEQLAEQTAGRSSFGKRGRAEGPWQIENPYECWRAIPDFLYRYLMYYENQERGSAYEPQLPEMFVGLRVDILSSTPLAGDAEEFVYGVRFRELVSMEEEAEELRKLPGARSGYDEGYEQLYFEWALHIRKTEGNVYELVGVAELSDALKLYEEEELSPDFEAFTELDLWQRSSCRARTTMGVPEVTWDNGETWKELPIALEKLTARGDEMDGALSGIQDKSYVVSEDLTAFAYGGSPEVPVTVSWSPDQGVTWNTSVVTHSYTSVRRLFLSFPDDENGFLVLTFDRTVWQEGTILFRTKDGGKTWEEVGVAGPRIDGTHSLTTGAEFITPEVGFLTIRDSDTPDLNRTADGGKTWEWIELPDVPQYYSMAYPPEWKGERLYLYLSMEEYSELGGEKARYYSEDLGETWHFDGIVLRK